MVRQFGDQVNPQTPGRPCLKQQIVTALYPVCSFGHFCPRKAEWHSLGSGLKCYKWKGSSLRPETELLAQKQGEQSRKDLDGEVLEIFQSQVSRTEIIIISFHLQIFRLLLVIWNFTRKDSWARVWFNLSLNRALSEFLLAQAVKHCSDFLTRTIPFVHPPYLVSAWYSQHHIFPLWMAAWYKQHISTALTCGGEGRREKNNLGSKRQKSQLLAVAKPAPFAKQQDWSG